jgi:hypothetical protein
MGRQVKGRLLLAACAVALLAGCAKPRPPLYLWESFPRQQYDALQRGGAGAQEQIAALEEHVVKARAQNAALPPGLRAHLGMLKLSIGDPGEARQLWLAEKLAFPESAPYMDQLLKRLDGPAAKTEKPA